MEAFSDRIFPPEGDQPGAVAMGAVVFMDHFLAERPARLKAARGAVAALDAKAREAHPDAAGFAELETAAASWPSVWRCRPRRHLTRPVNNVAGSNS